MVKVENKTETPSSSSIKELILAGIILAIVLVWIVTYVFYSDYMFWSGIAGVITIPFVLAAMMIDV